MRQSVNEAQMKEKPCLIIMNICQNKAWYNLDHTPPVTWVRPCRTSHPGTSLLDSNTPKRRERPNVSHTPSRESVRGVSTGGGGNRWTNTETYDKQPFPTDLADKWEAVSAPHLCRDLCHQDQTAQRVFCQVRVVVARLEQKDRIISLQPQPVSPGEKKILKTGLRELTPPLTRSTCWGRRSIAPVLHTCRYKPTDDNIHRGPSNSNWIHTHTHRATCIHPRSSARGQSVSNWDSMVNEHRCQHSKASI